jgi:hypothetical protein
VVENSGITVIHDLKVANRIQVPEMVLPSPNGTLFRCTIDNNGNWINVAI